MCDTAMRMDPGTINFTTSDGVLLRMPSVLLLFVANQYKTQEMCDKAAAFNPCMLRHVPDHFKAQEMCNRLMTCNPSKLWHVSDQEMCDAAVREEPSSLEYVPDWFVTRQQLKIWDDDDDDYYNDRLIEWYDGYQKCKVQKVKIKEELLPDRKIVGKFFDKKKTTN